MYRDYRTYGRLCLLCLRLAAAVQRGDAFHVSELAYGENCILKRA